MSTPRERFLHAIADGQQVVIGLPIDLLPPKEIIMTGIRRLAAVAPAPSSTPPAPSAPPDPQAQQKIEAIAKILGVDPLDLGAVATAFEALIGPASEADDAAARTLSASELAACRAERCSPSRFAALKAYGAKR